MYEYNVTISKVVDGDTVDVDIDLGFGMVYKKQRVRLMGIDTPESRTRDLVEKKFGKAAKAHLIQLLENGQISLVSHDKGKFGRILGELFVSHEDDTRIDVCKQMIDDHHAVEYTGANKDTTTAQHLEHRKLLIANGTVTQEQIDKVTK